MWNEIERRRISVRGRMLVFICVVFWGLCGCSRGAPDVIGLEQAVESQNVGNSGQSEEGWAAGNSGQTAGSWAAGNSGQTAGSWAAGNSGQTAQDQSIADGGTGRAENMIYVHVCGAVVSPGVVEVPQGSRAQAAVEAAGGFREDADTAYVNLAATVSDGEQLYIPTLEEAQTKRAVEEAAKSSLVNLNTADIALLCTLPGIGESRAGDIIAYRQSNGGFTGIEEIMNVSGIKESTYNKIKDLITVE